MFRECYICYIITKADFYKWLRDVATWWSYFYYHDNRTFFFVTGRFRWAHVLQLWRKILHHRCRLVGIGRLQTEGIPECIHARDVIPQLDQQARLAWLTLQLADVNKIEPKFEEFQDDSGNTVFFVQPNKPNLLNVNKLWYVLVVDSLSVNCYEQKSKTLLLKIVTILNYQWQVLECHYTLYQSLVMVLFFSCLCVFLWQNFSNYKQRMK